MKIFHLWILYPSKTQFTKIKYLRKWYFPLILVSSNKTISPLLDSIQRQQLSEKSKNFMIEGKYYRELSVYYFSTTERFNLQRVCVPTKPIVFVGHYVSYAQAVYREDRAYNSNFTIVINALTMGLLGVQRPSWPPPDFYRLFATFEPYSPVHITGYRET